MVADETLFYPGSTGKLFTWTAVMQLVEEKLHFLRTMPCSLHRSLVAKIAVCRGR